jgi:haloalkane dehalogenase
MTNATSHYTQVQNLRLHYLEAGTPDPNVPPILLLHGFPTSSHLYRNILPVLAKTHRAIAIDLPGYGLSDKPLDANYNFTFFENILEGFLDALDIRSTDLAVHDLGGPIGLFWAVRHPQRLKQLILLNTLVYPQTSWAVKLALIALRTPGVRDFIVSPKGIAGAMKFGVVHKQRLNREALTPYTAPFEDPAARRALPDVAKTMQRVKQDLPGAEVTSLPNCGHFLQEDEPERVGQLMAEFLNA